jgi:hypothetical protein
MSLPLTPLDSATLSAAVQKALSAGPAKMMAARGMLPLAPTDQAVVLYQISLDADQTLAAAARATAAGLPESLLAGIVANTTLDPRVLDFFATPAAGTSALFETLVLNSSTADETIARLAKSAGPREIDLIAENEKRLLRHPEIIGAMYLNAKARMSTVDRAVELAVRNSVRVPGVAAWDEISRALAQGGAATPDADALFAAAAAAFSGDDSVLTQGDAESLVVSDDDDSVPAIDEGEGKKVALEKMSVPAKLRLAQMGNGFARALLIRDPLRLVALAVIKSPGITDIEAGRYAKNVTLCDDVIRYIAGNGKWTKIYSIKVALCLNPKCPSPDAGRMLPFLREKDLKFIAKSKGVPSATTAQARRLLSSRAGGKS